MGFPQKIRFTHQDYLLLPEDKHYELIDGDLFMTPSPVRTHQEISKRLFDKINHFVEDHDLGEVLYAPFDVILSEEDVVQPDILFVAKENLGRITEKNVTGAPDLVIEILSPGSEQRDRVIKRKLYGRSGVREMWIVDPETQTIEVIGWEGSDFKTLQVYPRNAVLKSSVLEGFSLKLSTIFTS